MSASVMPTIPSVRHFEPATPLGDLVIAHRAQLLAAAERRHARDVRIFGSIARGEDTNRSDVDLLVQLDAQARPLDLLSLACDAEEILGVRVDVGTIESLRPDVRQDALNDAVLL
jgi:predicted nucleotidyltransferase